MSEYWKSTPQYWCKFCKTYVRETPLERRNHEASGKHQGNIQRSLRELHKNAEFAERDRQRAKTEVARLNGLVSGNRAGQANANATVTRNEASTKPPAVSTPHIVDEATRRRQQAEQLLALGMELPPELKAAVSGVGSWETISERVIHTAPSKQEPEFKGETSKSGGSIRKRAVEDADRSEDDGEDLDDGAGPGKKRKVWGSTIRQYLGSSDDSTTQNDLDALLRGVNPTPAVNEAEHEIADASDSKIKAEESSDTAISSLKPQPDELTELDSKISSIPPPVVFKKRKPKR